MVLFNGPLLQQVIAPVIIDQNRKRPVQYTIMVNLHLFGRANNLVIFSNEQ